MSNEMIGVPRSMLVDMAYNQHKKVAAYMPLIAPLLAQPAEQRKFQSSTAEALKSCAWPGVSIGNKAIIARAIEELEAQHQGVQPCPPSQ